jgi:hypothetical protein
MVSQSKHHLYKIDPVYPAHVCYQLNVFMIRLSNFPLLLGIAWYERQAKRNGTTTVYDTLSAAAEKVFETLPRSIKRLSEPSCFLYTCRC